MCVCARASWRNPTKLNGATCIINLVQFWLFFSFSGSTKTEIGHAIDVQFGECECVCMYRMWSSIQPFSINRNGKNGIWNAKRTDSLSQWHASVVPFRQFHQSNDFFFFSLFLRLSLPLPALRFCSLLVGVKLSNNIFPYVYLMAHSSKYRSSRIFSFISSVVFRVVRREIDGAVASYIDEHMCVYVLPDYHFGCCCCCCRCWQGAGRYTKWANNILN